MNNLPAPPTSEPDVPHPASELAEQLDTILTSIMAVIAAHFRILGAFTNPLWTRYSRARVRLATLLAKLAAGTWRPSRTQPPRPDRKPSTPTPARVPYSPHYHLWLIRKIGYRAAGHGSQLSHLLNTAETTALLATLPPQALSTLGQTLRPLCHLLGVDLPSTLLLPSPRVLRGAPEGGPSPTKPTRKPKPTPAPHRHPIYPQRKPRFTLYPDPPRRTRPA